MFAQDSPGAGAAVLHCQCDVLRSCQASSAVLGPCMPLEELGGLSVIL